jgi:hypothetical protein
MAQIARVAVVVRRGPASWAQLTLWDTQRDEFTPGAWFRGRIYEDKCDLSPDGQLFVYSALQGRRSRTSTTHCWTAVSRPPWLHALVLWPMGTTYGGGGRFVGNRRLVLRGAGKAHPEHPVLGIEVVPGEAQVHRSSGEIAGAGWSGRDQSDRLVFASRGCLFARTRRGEVELADFTAQSPEPRPAPEWATRALPGLTGGPSPRARRPRARA